MTEATQATETTETKPPVFRLENVAKTFEQGSLVVKAVDGIDLTIEAGEFVVIEGPSGSGKSTLLQLIGGLDRPSAGSVWFEDTDMATLKDGALADLRSQAFGFVFQQFNLIPTLTARENVEAALAPLGVKRRARQSRAFELLNEVGLGDRTDHLPSQLSGGEQQRVAIARALANDPRVLLADEPTGNLDSRTGTGIVELLHHLSGDQGRTVVLITHDQTIAAAAPRVIRLRDGRQTEDVVSEAGTFEAHLDAAGTPEGGRRSWAALSADWAKPTSDTPVILRAERVRKLYRTGEDAVEALRGIDLTVHEGEFVAVTGPSGSGKTTLLNCLSGLDRIDGGRVLLDGEVLHDIPDGARSRQRASTMGFIFQAYNLVPVFTAVENVELPLLLAGVKAGPARERALETLERVGLGHRVTHRPPELSGGEQQRVTIARALAGNPRIVWADEPTGNLDSETADSVMELLRQLSHEGLTLVIVTHDEGIADAAARRVRMRDGAIVGDDMQSGEEDAAASVVVVAPDEPEAVELLADADGVDAATGEGTAEDLADRDPSEPVPVVDLAVAEALAATADALAAEAERANDESPLARLRSFVATEPTAPDPVVMPRAGAPSSRPTFDPWGQPVRLSDLLADRAKEHGPNDGAGSGSDSTDPSAAGFGAPPEPPIWPWERDHIDPPTP